MNSHISLYGTCSKSYSVPSSTLKNTRMCNLKNSFSFESYEFVFSRAIDFRATQVTILRNTLLSCNIVEIH